MQPTQLPGSPAGLALDSAARTAVDDQGAPAPVHNDRVTSVRPVGVASSVSYLPELESMRGIAMLMVVLFHTNELLRFNVALQQGQHVDLFRAVIRGGEDGVGLFFVLSAFLLSIPFLNAARERRRVHLKRFAQRRALRILPLYYATAITGIVLTSRSVSEALGRYPYLVFPNGWPSAMDTPMRPFSDVWWSLETETQFYILLPLLGVALASRRGRLAGAAALGLYVAAYAIYQSRAFHPGSYLLDMCISLSLFGRGPFFVFGIGAAALYVRYGRTLRRWAHETAWVRNGGGDLALLTLLVGTAALLQWRVAVGLPLTRMPPAQVYQVVQALLFSMLVLVVLIAPLRLKALVHNPVFEHLGVLSYSTYMLHVPILYTGIMSLRRAGMREMFDWNFLATLMIASLLVLTYEASRLTYRFVEQPFLRRKEKLRG